MMQHAVGLFNSLCLTVRLTVQGLLLDTALMGVNPYYTGRVSTIRHGAGPALVSGMVGDPLVIRGMLGSHFRAVRQW